VQYACDGTTSEVTVARGLWDISDGAATTDTTPGIEESHDLLELADGEIWEVHGGTLSWPYTFEQFWDGWYEAGNGYLFEMRGVLGFLGIDFEPAMLSQTAHASSMGDVVRYTHHARALLPINAGSVGAGRRKLDRRTLEALSRLMGPQLENMGYDPVIIH